MTRLFHVSDLHFGREDKAALDWFAAAVKDERPDAVICTGDLTQRAKREEFAAACRWLETLDVPMTIEPGNHDLPYFNLFERFARPYRRYGRLETLIEKPLDIENVVVAPLKTTARFQWRHNWSWGVVTRKSLAKALAVIESAPRDHVVLVACHHPLIEQDATRVKGATIRGREALAALAEAGAHAVLSGHTHVPFDRDVRLGERQIRKIGAGTLSERVRETAPSFNEIEVGAGGAITVTHRWMGPATS